VGLYVDVICYHAFTAGRLNNRVHRRNRNVSRSVTWSPQELNNARMRGRDRFSTFRCGMRERVRGHFVVVLDDDFGDGPATKSWHGDNSTHWRDPTNGPIAGGSAPAPAPRGGVAAQRYRIPDGEVYTLVSRGNPLKTADWFE
jgi:hypothetical protein